MRAVEQLVQDAVGGNPDHRLLVRQTQGNGEVDEGVLWKGTGRQTEWPAVTVLTMFSMSEMPCSRAGCLTDLPCESKLKAGILTKSTNLLTLCQSALVPDRDSLVQACEVVVVGQVSGELGGGERDEEARVR